MISILPALLACGPEANLPEVLPEDPERTGTPLTGTATTSRCPALGPPCIDMLTVPVSWTTEAGWDFSGIVDLGDVNGDGTGDVGIGLYDADLDEAHTSVLFGPFVREVSLPSGEDLGLPDTGLFSSDLTGDGQLDLVLNDILIAGPVSSATTLADSLGTLGDGEIVDLDSDGDLDYVVAAPYQLDIWTGPWTTWNVDPPTLTLSLPCSEDRDPDRAKYFTAPDIDLDGVAELWVAGNLPQSDYNDCTFYRIPANLTGTIDVPQSYAPNLTSAPYPFGDQNGDGVTDFRIEVGDVYEIHSPPLTEGTELWTGTLLGVLPEATAGARPFPASVVGDSALDLYDSVYLPEIALQGGIFIAGGPDGGLFTGAVALTLLGSGTGTGTGGQVGSIAIMADERGARLYDLASRP